MAFTTDFKEAVLSGKITRVRIMLKDSILLSSGREDFKQMLNYAKSQIPTLMDAHDGESFKIQDEWNEAYLNEQMVTVVNNFSEERVDLLQKIVKKLYKPRVTISQANHSRNRSSGNGLFSMQNTGIMVAAVGGVTIVTGMAIKASILVPIVGVATLVVGGAMVIKGRKK